MGERRDGYRVLVRKPEGKSPLGRPDINGRIILRRIFRKCDGGRHWIDLGQDSERWWVTENAVMKLVFHKMWGISGLAGVPLNFSRRTLIHGLNK